MAKRQILIALIAAAIAAYFWFDLGQYFSLEAFKAQQAPIVAAKDANSALYIDGFFLLYISVTAWPLPGAAIVLLVAGAVFGLITGSIVVSFASSIGATLAFLSSRFLLRD